MECEVLQAGKFWYHYF